MDAVLYNHAKFLKRALRISAARRGPWRVEHEPWRRVRGPLGLGHARRAWRQPAGAAVQLVQVHGETVYHYVPDAGVETIVPASVLTFLDQRGALARRDERRVAWTKAVRAARKRVRG